MESRTASCHLARDPCLYPMDPMEMSCFDIRAAHVPARSAPRRSQDTRASKRRLTPPLRISFAGSTESKNFWTTPPLLLAKSSRSHPTQETQLEQQMHQSTCLNLNAGANTPESDLWILPDFDDWEVEEETSQQDHFRAPKKQGLWAPFVGRAVSSNRERLRRRLEGDGWDFVGGKYGEDGGALKEEANANETRQERVDEEFDLVVLPLVRAAC